MGFLDPLNGELPFVWSVKGETSQLRNPFDIFHSFLFFQVFYRNFVLWFSLFHSCWLFGLWETERDLLSGFWFGSEISNLFCFLVLVEKWCQWHATALILGGLCLIWRLVDALRMLQWIGVQWGIMPSQFLGVVIETVPLEDCFVTGRILLGVGFLRPRLPRLCLRVSYFGSGFLCVSKV